MSYYSGQGICSVAERNDDGTPKGFTDMGNVSALSISLATTIKEHKESRTGARLTDGRLVTEIKGTFKMTADEATAVNLANSFWGDYAANSAGLSKSVTVKAHLGLGTLIPGYANISAFSTVVSSDSVGAIQNVGITAGGTGYTVGDTLTLTTTGSNATVVVTSISGGGATGPVTGVMIATKGSGYTVATGNVTTGGTGTGCTINVLDVDPTTFEYGTSATSVSSKNGWIDLKYGMINTFSLADQAARSATSMAQENDNLTISFTTGATTTISAFTKTMPTRWIRFNGLNTINSKPVIVDIFMASFDPAKTYDLINDDFAKFDLEGSIQYDALQPSASKFFQELIM